MSKDQTQPIASRLTKRRVGVTLVIGAIIVSAFFWSQHQYERLRAKQTLTNISTLGKICLNEQPEAVDRESLRRLAERLGALRADELLEDGWGNEIKVIRSTDQSGVHYTVFAVGPEPILNSPVESFEGAPPEVSQAAFVWKDGTWIRDYDPRRD